MAEAGHSSYSASGFEATMLCPGKPVMEAGKPNNANIYSATGTAAHTLLEFNLRDGREPAAFLGRIFPVEGFDIEVDEDMVDAVNTAIRNIKEMAGDGMILSEQRVNYADAIGVGKDEAWGTADVIVARGDELQVHDYKNGRKVVDAEHNPQMMLYGLGALEAVDELLGPFKTVRLVIHQPNVKDAPSEWACTVQELRAWAAGPAWGAVEQRQEAYETKATLDDTAWAATYLTPGEKQCMFCKAKATCPALRAEVASTVALESYAASPEEFADMEPLLPTAQSDDTWLAVAMDKADLIEDWIKAVRAEVERRLLAGEPVQGYKIVQGKMGHRKWSSAEEAEKTMKSMRLKIEDMYDFKLISPTTAEKLSKAKTIGPRQWPALKTLITQSQGKPHVAPVSDSRPALTLTPVVDDFSDVSVDDFA
ncbi:Protein of unknown function DUF2800 [uncultured Caudovirales phage]|uniref:Uncharacterized protein n=1 Tax=uncultured Caudovirales phage TaxID=2100421 RepID=A0A6J5KXE4_9CAUD|nr:Protein of unknown function DUF2800 [uncultured Caudovirales phage]